ncbi:hypothetical protein SUGI_1080450 [Cryptomeria japonica]|nr:hypothetical protein SUGI_1080450 [Cryptomeria japonica]
MFDGVVKMLTGVRHVQELKKNLVYLGVLDFDGYNFSSQGGVLKVSKGSLVLMEATKFGNLCRLKGSTELVKTMVASDEPTCFWKLGDMSVERLEIL